VPAFYFSSVQYGYFYSGIEPDVTLRLANNTKPVRFKFTRETVVSHVLSA